MGALSDPLVSYRLTIVSSPVSKPGQGGAGGGADGAITQRCLFSTPQNLLRCEDGVFQGSIGYRSEAKCETSDPEIAPGGDVDAAGAPVGGIKITPPQTSCGTTVKPLTLTLRTPAAVSSLTLTLERGDQRFAPVEVSLLPTQVRPDGPKCGVSCSQSLAALPLGALTSTR